MWINRLCLAGDFVEEVGGESGEPWTVSTA